MKNLIIQSPFIEPAWVERLAHLSACREMLAVSEKAFRLTDIKDTPILQATCQTLPIDWAIRDNTPLTDFGLLATDMDSTLITIECIDEIADICGIKPEISAITASAMRGEMDFTESLKRRVSLLAGLDEQALYDVYEKRLRYNPGAQTLIAGLKKAQIKTLLVSGGFTFFTERIIDALHMDAQCANELEIVNGKLTGRVLGDIIDAKGKADALLKACETFGLSPRQTIAVGDGANDLMMMAQAGLSVAYHAKPRVAELADVAFNHVGLDGIIALFPPLS